MSEFLARKVKTFFKHLDFDHDGFISLKDFAEMGERHCDAQKADATEREKNRACFHKVWRNWMKSTDSDDNGLLTPSIMAESILQQRNDPDYREAYLAMCHQFFHILDVNGDGFLQEDEYARAALNSGMQDASIIRRAFETIDLNQDGKLSCEEFSTALLEYHTSEDENNRYNGLWGPLV